MYKSKEGHILVTIFQIDELTPVCDRLNVESLAGGGGGGEGGDEPLSMISKNLTFFIFLPSSLHKEESKIRKGGQQ
jgi:hypothetical protein